ncbi:MAG: phage protease [Syntrophobacteraceae bacterium]
MGNELKLSFIAEMPANAGEVPPEFQVFPRGRVEIEGSDGFTVDAESVDAVIRRFNSRGLDMVVDYEHQTEKDAEAPAAGWIRELVDRGGDGLWAKVEWTDRARQYLANREYRYYSPVFRVSGGGRRLVELLRVALTNAPRLNRIRPIVAGMNPSDKKEDAMEFLVSCARKLGLPEGVDEEEVLAAIEKKAGADGGSMPACKEVLDALGLQETAKQSEIVATIHALNALKQRPDLTKEVTELKAKLAARERDELVAAAMKDGRITPAQKDWAEKYAAQDPEGFRLFVAKAPQVVPVGTLHPARNPAERTGLDDAQLEINKLLGISEETWKKYNPQV